MAKANYMAKVRVSGICHWMAFASVLWQNPGRLQKVTSMGFVMEWLLPYNKDGFSQLYIVFLSEINIICIAKNCAFSQNIFCMFFNFLYFDLLEPIPMSKNESEILLDLKKIDHLIPQN